MQTDSQIAFYKKHIQYSSITMGSGRLQMQFTRRNIRQAEIPNILAGKKDGQMQIKIAQVQRKDGQIQLKDGQVHNKIAQASTTKLLAYNTIGQAFFTNALKHGIYNHKRNYVCTISLFFFFT